MPDDTKVFDVAKPGNTAPDPTSRPVIVGHGTTMAHDPMVSSDEASVTKSASDTSQNTIKSAPTSREKSITPPTNDAEKSTDKTTDEGLASDKTPEIAASGGSDAAAVDAVVSQAANQKKDTNVEEARKQQEEARQKHITTMIEAKTYFLPIGQVTHKRNVRNGLIALVVLVTVVGGTSYIAYSMGFLKQLR